MRESVEVVELLLAGRDEEAAQHFARAERAAKAAAERQIPRISIWTGEPGGDED
jgi:hypothetical protein